MLEPKIQNIKVLNFCYIHIHKNLIQSCRFSNVYYIKNIKNKNLFIYIVHPCKHKSNMKKPALNNIIAVQRILTAEDPRFFE